MRGRDFERERERDGGRVGEKTNEKERQEAEIEWFGLGFVWDRCD